jgi:glycosyltransferase involved in cell wall biosynthesis
MTKLDHEAHYSISIAMATYNGAKHLQAQLDSFLVQTRLPNELVVCDDGSSDSTIDILERFVSKAPFAVKIYRNEVNLGFTKNFEKALMKCSGDLIFLSDQDDVWFENKLSVVEKAFHLDTTKLLVISDGNLVDEDLNWHGVTAIRQVIAGFGTTDALVVGALSALRKEYLSFALPIPDGFLGHDVWLHGIARQLGTRLVLRRSLQSIRRHSANTSNWVASSVEKINRFDVFKSQLKTVVSSGYEDRLLINQSASERITLISKQGNDFSKEVVENSLLYLTLERRAIEFRNRIPRANFIQRKVMALLMLLNGNYRFFNGYKSFFRDFIR